MRLTRLHKFEIPVQIGQLKLELERSNFSRDDAYAKIDQLEIFIENEGYTEDICEWRSLRVQLEKERNAHEEKLVEILHMKKSCFDCEQNIKTKKVLKDRIRELTESNKLLVQKFQDDVGARESLKDRIGNLEEDKEREAKKLMKQVDTQTVDHLNTHGIHAGKLDKINYTGSSDNKEIGCLGSKLSMCDKQQQSIKNFPSEEYKKIICSLEHQICTLSEKLEFYDLKQLKEVTKLQKENTEIKLMRDKLQRELNIFDLDFFEEIEDLKFKYYELSWKLKSHKSIDTTKIALDDTNK